MIKEACKIRFEYLPCINYSMTHNGINVCTICEISNLSGTDLSNVNITIEGELILNHITAIDNIASNSSIEIKDLRILPNIHLLIGLTENITSAFTLTLSVDGEVIFKEDYPLTLMAFDYWTGSHIFPELVCAFITPNHPLVSRVVVNASKFLEKFTSNSALDEYQTQDPNRVRAQVASIYEALRSEALIYCAPPASFEEYGQRVRLADKVLNEKIATCLDLTLLYASCLEAIGIHPVLILLKGHIFVGAWLINDTYIHTTSDDATFLLKSSADGINEMVMVETTALTSSSPVSFEEAVILADNALRQENRFELFIDVKRSRFEVKPLPQRNNIEGIWTIENEGIEHINSTAQVNTLTKYDIILNDTNPSLDKQTIWERKLLDFSLRNNLLNVRLGRRVIPFISFNIDKLEDYLQAGKNFTILPNPSATKIEPNETGMYDSLSQRTGLEQLITDELNNKRLYSYLNETELQNALKFIYRSSRTSLEENGANSLFLVLGLLKWYETDKSEKIGRSSGRERG